MKIRTLVIPALVAAATGLAAGLAYQPAKEHAKQPAKEHATQPAKEHVKQPDGAGMDPKMMEMMQKMMEAGTPGEMHKVLADQAGEWDYVSTFRFDPSMPEETSNGHAKIRLLYDGRFIEAEMNGKMQTPVGEMPFNGRATMGYNNMTKKFESTWIDSMSTQTMFGTGTYDAAKKQMTVVMEGTDCMTGKPCKMTEVTTHHDDNHFTSEFTMPDMNGKDFKGMTIKYTRKGASESHSPAKAPATKAPATKPAR